MTLCLLYELYGRPEIIAFLEALVPRVTTESLSPDSGVADICSKIVEPICTHLYEATERQQVPVLLKVILRAIHRHHHHALHAEDYLSIILTPYVCNALVDNHVQRGLHMDPASQHIVNRVRDLLFACFDPHVGKKLQLSLSDSAALSRSRWFIARAMASLVEDERPFPSSGIAKMVLSPVAQLAYMRPETNRPKALDSFICLKPSELLYMLKMFDLASIATSLLISSSRAVSESMSILSSSDLVTKLSGYVITNANNASNVPAGGVTSTGGGGTGGAGPTTSSASITPAVATNRRTYLPTVLDRDVVYIFDLDEHERDKDPLLDLLDDDDFVATGSDQVRNYFDLPVTSGSGNNGVGSGSGAAAGGAGAGAGNGAGSTTAVVTTTSAAGPLGNNGLLLTTEEESAAANELQVINWLLTAARTSLKNVFEHVTKVHSVHTVRELHELRDKLRSKLPVIRAVLGDWQALLSAQELVRSQHAQITVLQDLYKSRKLKSEFFKGPTTMMGPPMNSSGEASLLSYSSSSSTGRFPVLIAAMRMIYVDYVEVRPLVLNTVVDEDKEHLLIRIYHQHMQMETRLLLQRLSDAMQPIAMNNNALSRGAHDLTRSSSSSLASPTSAARNKALGDEPLTPSKSSNTYGSGYLTTSPRAARNMNPLWVIMQNVFPAQSQDVTY